MSAKYVEITLIKVPVIKITKAITENSNILLFKRNLSVLNSEMILGFKIVNEYHKDNKNKTAKVAEINPW